MKAIIKILFLLCFAIIGSYLVYHLPTRENVNMKNIDLNRYKKLMIVAHPDDEMIWGGTRLIEDDYVVVCITCGSNNQRLNEFRKVMEKTDDSYIALGYPDIIFGKRNDWKYFSKYIIKDITNIINSNDWDLIVTHNKEGEYGHIHHKLVNKFVTDIYNSEKIDTGLYYFGKYYTRKKLAKYKDKLTSVSDELLKEKMEILGLYESQSFVIDMLGHMMKYEMWEEYIGE